MARKCKNPLEGKTQTEIDAIMTIRPKDMDEDQMKVYKKVKLIAWLARGKKKDPSKKTAEKAGAHPPIAFIQEAIRNAAEMAAIAIKPLEPIAAVGNGKLPNWVKIPDFSDKMKEWTENRRILVSFSGNIRICNLNWLDDDDMPTVTGGDVPPFFFDWPNALVSVKYGFVRNYERDGIKKENETLVSAVA